MRRNRPDRLVKKIATQFKLLRLASGLSHDNLAKKSGVTRPAISHIENGKRKPSLLMALKLAEALEKELSEIISQAEKSESNK